jgi:putative protease
VAERRHLLSLRDLRLDGDLPALLDAGVTSFKIEGRLKDLAYVANLTAHYRARLDAALRERDLGRSSSGLASPGFTPDPAKTFNRGFTRYFLEGRGAKIGSPATPKMAGERVGRVRRVAGAEVALDASAALQPGDGLAFFDAAGELRGTAVNAVGDGTITVQSARGLRPGTVLHRNHDHAFLAGILKAKRARRIGVRLTLAGSPGGISLTAEDEDGVRLERALPGPLEPARDAEGARDTIRRQLAKTGQSDYACSGVSLEVSPVPFLAISLLNALRRDTLEALTAERERRRPRARGVLLRSDDPSPERELSHLGNVLNARAEAFYRRHGVTRIEPAAESGLEMRGRTVMTTRYCVLHQLDLCRAPGLDPSLVPPLLVDDEGNRLRLDIDCARCGMDVILESR